MPGESKFFRLIQKPWESAVLRKPVYSLEVNLENLAPGWFSALRSALSTTIEDPALGKPCMIMTRLDAQELRAVQVLCEARFRLVECYLEYDHDLKAIPASMIETRIEPFEREHIPVLERMALASFRFSRFHMDEAIPVELANKTRAEWVRNACLGRAETVLVSREQAELTGFVICRQKSIDDTPAGVLDLMAVSEQHRHKGLGNALTIAFLNYCIQQGYGMAFVGTQAHNVASNRLYQKTGFRLHKAYYSLHLHLE